MAPISKKRRLAHDTHPVESLTFDPSARSDYLTGFHKRKVARKESAREAAIKRDKEEKVRERKQLRDQRKEDLESHIAAVNDELKKQNAILNGESEGSENDEEFAGFDAASPAVEAVPEEQLPSDEEYVDEDRYTTVTVEPMGEESDEDEHEKPVVDQTGSDAKKAEIKKKRPWAKGKEGEKRPKKKKFRYESKAERSLTRQKQKSKNRAAKARRTGD